MLKHHMRFILGDQKLLYLYNINTVERERGMKNNGKF